MKQKFWGLLCDTVGFWIILFGLCVIFLVILAFSVSFIKVGSTPYYLTIVNSIIIIGTMMTSMYVIRKCRT
ncbi:hypothetical protein [Halocatena marina]|uniref:hypothetical protein n=1 Tax=Halocatena marina TaxID=2934937 RepID=UPI0022245C88|nr:hypothetical protein [Halocatena marina]